MLRTRYPACRMAATTMLCLVLLLVAACAAKKAPLTEGGKAPTMPLAATPKASISVQALMRLALEEGHTKAALTGLQRLADEAASPIKEEAMFRYVQLLLFFNDGQAMVEAKKILAAYPEHALIPYLHMWIAQWAEAHQDNATVLVQTAAALAHPRLTLEIANRVIGLGSTAARRSPDWDAVQWFLNVARLLPYGLKGKRDNWLREAAARASMSMIGRLRDAGQLHGEVGQAFYLYAARAHLMMGDMSAVQTLSAWLKKDFPYANEASRVATWAVSGIHQVNIGVMLPLTGKYARFGEQALRGMRLALNSLQGNGGITLHIADTKSDSSQCVGAYQQLVHADSAMILGPLLEGCVTALTPRLHDNIPVLSLTSQSHLAVYSPMLFVHTLALTMQARFMAARAWQQGARRMVVINTDNPSSKLEGDIFTQTFKDLGGEVVDDVDIAQNGIDFRSDLRAMRRRTDDEELLNDLDEALALSVDPDQEIRMPVNFDAVYLALPGKKVALLAGQLAYVDVNNVPLYGSGRWQDGNLLSDNGRYLGRAQFSDVAFPNGTSPELQHFMLTWRELRGADKPGKLVGLAYDSTLIAALLTSRLGLAGEPLVAGLHEIAGFPGLTGHVRFDENGVGHKDFELFRIRHGHIVPAG